LSFFQQSHFTNDSLFLGAHLVTLAKFIALLLAFSVATDDVLAAEIRSEDLDDGLSMISITGDIESGDSAKFRREAARHETAVVVLESEGGSTIDAIEIGEAIRIRGFSTLVFNDNYCASACGLIWLAGTPRRLSQSARVGFHATYIAENGQRLESGVGNALVGRYFAILNLPQKAIIFATSASPNDANWLTVDNATSYGIEVTSIDDFVPEEEDPQETKEPSGPPAIQTYRTEPKRETTVWGNAGEWSVNVDHTLGDSCFALRYFDDGTAFRVGLDLRFGNQSYVMLSNREWASIEVEKNYPMTIQFDGLSPWEANATGMKLGDLTILYVPFEDTKFWGEFSSANAMRLGRNGRNFATMPLNQSANAVDQLIDCQRASNEVRSARDPFKD